MSVVPKPIIPPRRPRSRRAAISSHLNQPKVIHTPQITEIPQSIVNPKVERLPDLPAKPVWLRSLTVIQRSTYLLAILLIGSTLATYAWTVYSQKLWSQEYRKLGILQRHERHLTATNEIMKNHLANEAENPNSALVPPDPSKNIYIAPAPQRPARVKPAAPPEPEPKTKMPLGY